MTKPLIALGILLWVQSVPAKAAELLMFEEPGCAWCQRWHAEIGPGYPKSEEGHQAPLRRLDFRNPLPEGVKLEKAVTLTPTFIVIEDGVERGRLLGYAGAHFFYPMLDGLLKRVQPSASDNVPVERDKTQTSAKR